MNPLDADSKKRLEWYQRVVSAMLPLAVWWGRGAANRTTEELQAHLDQYEGLLDRAGNGDPVSPVCRNQECLPNRRRSMSADPLVMDCVLLLDHPHRVPFPYTPSLETPGPAQPIVSP